MKQVYVKGMSCAHCTGAVKQALETAGLSEVQVDLETGLASFLETADMTAQTLAGIIEDVGFEVGEIS